jgi:hypothetical protein
MSDFLTKKKDGVYIVVRDQKTTRSKGFYRYKLRSPVLELLSNWIDVVRPALAISLAFQHKYGFICLMDSPV